LIEFYWSRCVAVNYGTARTLRKANRTIKIKTPGFADVNLDSLTEYCPEH
jgi:hypothetical protein